MSDSSDWHVHVVITEIIVDQLAQQEIQFAQGDNVYFAFSTMDFCYCCHDILFISASQIFVYCYYSVIPQ